MSFRTEPEFRHGEVGRIGVLLVNLGSPQAPTPAAVRRYLAEFLSDSRVVEIPRLVWWFILHGFILRTRPAKSAAKYAKIWLPEGSPLLLHGKRQAQMLTGYLGERLKRAGRPPDQVEVKLAMRYGEPSIAKALAALRDAGCDRLLVLPLYPQYAASTTGSVCDAVFDALKARRRVPALRIVASYHDDSTYIAALARRVNAYWEKHGQPDCLLLSFHGLPKYTLDRGDPYHCQCQKTSRLLARELGLTTSQWRVAFQSRFGRTEWLQPYTSEVLRQLGREHTRRVDVFCPGFAADCLETLEEIAIEGKADFLAAGGGEFHYIPALNELPEWIAALADIAFRELGQEWLAKPDAAELQRSRSAAVAMGAPR